VRLTAVVEPKVYGNGISVYIFMNRPDHEEEILSAAGHASVTYRLMARHQCGGGGGGGRAIDCSFQEQ
jgi:hypothetical protein